MPSDAPRHSILDAPFDFYFRPEKSGGRCLIGAALKNEDDRFEDVRNPALDPPGVTQDMSVAVWKRAVKRFPALEAARLHQGYTGIADMTPDHQPLLGKLPIEGLFLAAGMSGVGFKMAPSVGEAMAGLVAGDVDAEALLNPLRPTRIQEQQLLIRTNPLSLMG